MFGDLPIEGRREYATGDAPFELPIRPLGWGKLLWVFLVGFGLVFLWIPARGLWRIIQQWPHETPDGMDLFSGLFDLAFVIGGCLQLGFGLLMLFGRCRVEWKDGRLRSTEMLGPLRWTRRMPRKPVRRLEVNTATSQRGTSPPRRFDRFSTLTAVFEDGSKKLVVLGYPKDWLLALAQELKDCVGASALSAGSPQVQVVEKLSPDDDYDDVLEQPAGSLVQVEERTSGVRLIVPPTGIWRGSGGLFTLALMWCGLMTFFTAMTVRSVFKTQGVAWFPILFDLVFWGIGLGMLAGAIRMGRRMAVLAVEGGRLLVITQGLFGAKQLEWTRGELSAIRAGAGRMAINERPVIELQIHPLVGKKVGLLAGREEEELRWMATRLRRVLNVPARVERL